MIFDIENIGDDFGKYEPNSGEIVIFLGTIYHDFKKNNCVLEDLLRLLTVDVIVHEDIHKVIDDCLDGNPEEVDDHKIFKWLVN